MKLSLQLKMGQSLTMTPQLQQAIRLLQLSSIELQAKIQDALESNMMLEIDEDETSLPDQLKDSAQQASEPPDTSDDDLVHQDWLDSDSAYLHYSSARHQDYQSAEHINAEIMTLKKHLEWQLNLIPISDKERIIAMAIIDSLNDDGYLSCDILDLIGVIEGIGIKDIETVLHMIQAMDPVGVGARDIRECLHIQLKKCPPETRYLKQARDLVDNYFQLLASHNYKQLMRKMKMGNDELKQVIALIQSMNPRPGNQINHTKTEYIMPDIYVKKIKGVWKVELNKDSMLALRVNPVYAGMLNRPSSAQDRRSLKSHLQEAKWFINNLQNRNETLLRVAASIVERQQSFLEHGAEAMKPLILGDIATALDLHESTISRVTTRKYMYTPRGIFELKYFFSSHVNTSYGGICSSTAIKALIKKLVDEETPNKPFSDSKIAAILANQSINIARRTVAKYRESMFIPPSKERKRLA